MKPKLLTSMQNPNDEMTRQRVARRVATGNSSDITAMF